ncbi:MAG: ATP-binding protein [Pelovirga sp.]
MDVNHTTRRRLLARPYCLVLVVGLILLVTVLHYLTSNLHTPFHDIYRRLYYLPIVLAGIWYGLKGGLLAAVTVSVLYLPHVLWQLVPFHGNLLEQLLEMLLYHVVGGVTGLLSQREKRQQLLYQQAAERLERSYAQLRRQADELIAAETQLHDNERLSTMGEMSAALAHEIRNPLGSIRMAAEVVTEDLPETDRRYEFGRILIKETQRLNNVLEEFLSIARTPGEERERIELVQLFGDLTQQLGPVAAKAGVQILVDASDLTVTLARMPLQQALFNLMQNGIQAMAGGGTLHLAAFQTEREVRILVRDTGEGIGEEALTKIFDPFFTTREDGTGLGLAITSRLVKRLGGTLEVSSQPGHGTEFSICLPVAAGQEKN